MIEALAARPANGRIVAAVAAVGQPAGFVNLHAMDVHSGVRKSSPQGQFRLMAPDPLKPTVFVVDDDPSVRVAILRLFESVGLNCETFASGADFLKRAEQGVTGCVVLDVRMPGPSGLELQRLLRDAGHDLPVIFVTAFADVPLTVRAMKAGALEVLTKPFDDQALLDVVHFGLEQGRRRQEEHNEIKRLQVRYDTLTPREREVMAMVVTGKLNKQIAAELGTTEKTIKVHRAQVMHKMAADSVAVLVRMADRLKSTAKRPS